MYIWQNFLYEPGGLLLKVIHLVITYISGLLFCVIMIMIFKEKKSKNVFKRVGSISAEMIMVQGVFLYPIVNGQLYADNDLLYILLVFVLQIILLIVLDPVYRFLTENVNKFYNKRRCKHCDFIE